MNGTPAHTVRSAARRAQTPLRSRRIGTVALLLFGVGIPMPARAQSFDLTGLWRDDSGSNVVYRLRQVGTRLYWIVDGVAAGRYANLAYGEISGNTVTGIWVDMPGSPTLGNGNITLRVDSNDRIVKVAQSANYHASVWTRIGSSAPPSSMPPVIPPPTGGSGAVTPVPVITGGGTVPGSGGVPGGSAPGTNAGAPLGWGERPDSIASNHLPVGRRLTYYCPPRPDGAQPYPVWGTDIYTSDTFICYGAVHAGVITFAGGTVVVELSGPRPSFEGSDRNGVRSAPFGAWGRSLFFVGGRVAPPPPPPPAPPTTTAPTIEGGVLGWTDRTAAQNRGKIGTRVRYTCPPGGQVSGWVWGTDVYTDDSMICQAAVHAGAITHAGGGTFLIEIRPGQPSYTGSARNGITTANYDRFDGSFSIVR